MSDVGLLLRYYLLFFILPLWVVASLTDYVLHKRTRIQENAGTKESILHAIQLSEAGLPVLLGRTTCAQLYASAGEYDANVSAILGSLKAAAK